MLMSALEKADEPQDVKELLTELFSSANYFSSPFRGLETNYLQQQYFIKEFGMIVSTFNLLVMVVKIIITVGRKENYFRNC